MIKIQNYGYPVVFQSDNSYSLPSMTGAVQWNGMSKRLEVSNGSAWVAIDNTVTLNTDAMYNDMVQWAKKKMEEEKELEALAQSDPTIKDLYDQIKQKQDQIKMVQLLKKKEVNETGQSN